MQWINLDKLRQEGGVGLVFGKLLGLWGQQILQTNAIEQCILVEKLELYT